MPKVINAKNWNLTPAPDGRRYSKYADGTLPTPPDPPVDPPAGDTWPTQNNVAYTPAIRNRRGYAMGTRHAFTGATPQIIEVTNLNNTGTGSFKAALSTSGNKIIVFRVGGTINWQDSVASMSNDGKTWVAGQTAPAPGVSFVRGRISAVNASDVLMQHIRIHSTEENTTPPWASSLDWGPYNAGQFAGNLVFHKCEFAFSRTGRNVSLTRYLGAVDLVECSLIWPISNSVPSDGFNMMYEGALAGSALTMQGCFIAHGYGRNPFLASSPSSLLSGNIHYNWQNDAASAQSRHAEHGFIPGRVSCIDSHFKRGPSYSARPGLTLDGWSTDLMYGCTNGVYDGQSKVHMSGNKLDASVPADSWSLVNNGTNATRAQLESASILNPPSGFARWSSADAAVTHVLANAGCRPTARRPAMVRAVNDYTNGTGALIQSSATLGADGPDYSLTPADHGTTFQQRYEAAGYVWANRFSDHATETGRKNVEVYLLNLGEAL